MFLGAFRRGCLRGEWRILGVGGGGGYCHFGLLAAAIAPIVVVDMVFFFLQKLARACSVGKAYCGGFGIHADII